jgi:hypothetical protein
MTRQLLREQPSAHYFTTLFWLEQDGEARLCQLQGLPGGEGQHEAMRELGAALYRDGARPLAVVLAGEVWAGRYKRDEWEEGRTPLPRDDPGRREKLCFWGMTPDGRSNGAVADIMRREDGAIVTTEPRYHYCDSDGEPQLRSRLVELFFEGVREAMDSTDRNSVNPN